MLSPKRVKLSEPTTSEQLLELETSMSENLKSLHFSKPIEYVYNPLEYAYGLHSSFVNKYLPSRTKILFLGMNPGPWGMSQTGIPFGEVNIVKDWFKINGDVGHPVKEHPARQITGLQCQRSEISGKKFWEFFKQLCGDPHVFFRYSFVYNICPLAFLTNTGKNITPAELKGDELKILNNICDQTFVEVVKLLKVEHVIGIGKFAEKRALVVLKNNNLASVQVSGIPHPSPRNLKNAKNWSEVTLKILSDLHLLSYFECG